MCAVCGVRCVCLSAVFVFGAAVFGVRCAVCGVWVWFGLVRVSVWGEILGGIVRVGFSHRESTSPVRAPRASESESGSAEKPKAENRK